MGMTALIYRYEPDRRKPKWKWASPGVIVAAILWILGSILFTVYVYHFDSYNKTYGSLGAPLALLTWMWLSVFVVLFGAEINGEAERQTRQDTTAGAPLPIGRGNTEGADMVTRGPRRRMNISYGISPATGRCQCLHATRQKSAISPS
jgi:membrane protein